MSGQNPGAEEIVADAVAAFDAGNHAFGRYRHFVLSAHPEALAVSAGEARAALQEAAISVADAQAGDVVPFRAALRVALENVMHYRQALPEGVPRTELDETIEDLEEALTLLSGDVDPPPSEG
jgi:hypothetical protein